MHILLRVDNTTALACINRMGSIQYPQLNFLTRQIWNWCEKRNLWMHASYVCSRENKADESSRCFSLETEWELSSIAFLKITKVLGNPTIDLFASRLNTKCDKYVSWRQDPNSIAVDSFTISWKNIFFYAFPPFSLILRVLNKIIVDQAAGIIVVPYWPSQPWFPLYKLLISKEVTFRPSTNLLLSPFREPHPLHRSLTLVAGHLCGKLGHEKVTRRNL